MKNYIDINENTITELANSSEKEFIIRCDMIGGKFSPNDFLKLLSKIGIDDYGKGHIKNIDAIIEVEKNRGMFTDALKSKSFWNRCGRFVKCSYSNSDKTDIFIVSKLMGFASNIVLSK